MGWILWCGINIGIGIIFPLQNNHAGYHLAGRECSDLSLAKVCHNLSIKRTFKEILSWLRCFPQQSKVLFTYLQQAWDDIPKRTDIITSFEAYPNMFLGFIVNHEVVVERIQIFFN